MTDNIENMEFEDFEEAPVFTLVDEETKEEKDFVLLARTTIDNQLYYALEPADEEDNDEYVILKVSEDGNDIILETIDDDEEFEKAEDAFNDLFFSEIDYDEE
jgi:hypothetical protein